MNEAADYGAFLRTAANLNDEQFPLGEVALALAAMDRPGIDLRPYWDHMRALAMSAQVQLKDRPLSPKSVAQALAHVLAISNGYVGDTVTYDDLANADLISVIDRRRGLPVSLGILYLETAAQIKFPAVGLNTPAHFLVRIGDAETGIIIDPFNGGIALRTLPEGPQRPGIRQSPPSWEAMSRRAVVIRLLNNIRVRAQQAHDAERAHVILQRMAVLAPAQADIWFELGAAASQTGHLIGARKAYEQCLTLAQTNSDIGREAKLALDNLRRRLN